MTNHFTTYLKEHLDDFMEDDILPTDPDLESVQEPVDQISNLQTFTKLISNHDESIIIQAIKEELQASHFYKHLANQCQRLGLFGASKYFLSESNSEVGHYQNLVNFLNERGSVALLPTVDSINVPISCIKDCLLAAYTIEVELSKKYESWYTLVLPTTQQFLLQYIEIQRVSVGEYADLLTRYSLIGDSRSGQIIFDQELGGLA